MHEGASESGGGKIITSEPEEDSFTLQALTAVLSFHCTLDITCVQLTDLLKNQISTMMKGCLLLSSSSFKIITH